MPAPHQSLSRTVANDLRICHERVILILRLIWGPCCARLGLQGSRSCGRTVATLRGIGSRRSCARPRRLCAPRLTFHRRLMPRHLSLAYVRWIYCGIAPCGCRRQPQPLAVTAARRRSASDAKGVGLLGSWRGAPGYPSTHESAGAGWRRAAGLAAAVHARISLYDGGQYPFARWGRATPTELADSVRDFADSLMGLGSAANAGALDSALEPTARLAGVDAANAKIGQRCASDRCQRRRA